MESRSDLSELLRGAVEPHLGRVVALRRDLHAHPELGRSEVRSTQVVAAALSSAGLAPRRLDLGTGLTCDIGSGPRVVALRADLDALPVPDVKDVPYRSQVEGVCHACGHDAHTAMLVGAGLALAGLAEAGQLPGRVRLLFQPAEELMPGGALDVVASGALAGVERIFALHCDPRLDVGHVGLRKGAVSAAADRILVRLSGPGGHTARPHLTGDLVYALAYLATELPAVLSRRVDPRAALSVVWGRIVAGGAANAIPRVGEISGTVRSLDTQAWHDAPKLIEHVVELLVAPFAVEAEIDYQRGVPPVVNEAVSTRLLEAAVRAATESMHPGDPGAGVAEAEQSLGGEDFAWYLHQVPGALGRLGVRRPGSVGTQDLHQGSFDLDEDALAVGARVLVGAALAALDLPAERAGRLAR